MIRTAGNCHLTINDLPPPCLYHIYMYPRTRNLLVFICVVFVQQYPHVTLSKNNLSLDELNFRHCNQEYLISFSCLFCPTVLQLSRHDTARCRLGWRVKTKMPNRAKMLLHVQKWRTATSIWAVIKREISVSFYSGRSVIVFHIGRENITPHEEWWPCNPAEPKQLKMQGTIPQMGPPPLFRHLIYQPINGVFKLEAAGKYMTPRILYQVTRLSPQTLPLPYLLRLVGSTTTKR